MKSIKTLRLFGLNIVFCAAVMLGGCRRAAPPPVPIADLTGTWQGTFQGPAIKGGKIVFELNQSGTAISGRFIAQDPVSGEIQGSYKDQSLVISLKQLSPQGCSGSFAGGGRVDDKAISLYISGTNCYSTISNEQAILTKQ